MLAIDRGRGGHAVPVLLLIGVDPETPHPDPMHIAIGHPRAIGHTVRQTIGDLPSLAVTAEDIARKIIGALAPPATVGADHHGIAIAPPRAGPRELADFCGLEGVLRKPRLGSVTRQVKPDAMSVFGQHKPAGIGDIDVVGVQQCQF